MMLRVTLCLAILLLAACQAAAVTLTPTATEPPTARPMLQRQATSTPRVITTLTETHTPTVTTAPPTAALAAPTTALIEAITLADTNPAVNTLVPAFMTIGYSTQGRPLTAQQFGTGSRVLLLVGGIHGGWEANTVALMWELAAHFDAAPEEIPAEVALVIIPLANPDGYELGRVARGRFNAAGVDLNRNWSCEWSEAAYWQRARVNPGGSAMSEVETLVLADYILRTRPMSVLFYHSAANGIFAGACNGVDGGSRGMAAVFGDAAGYPHEASFTAYPITGAASNWAAGEGIPAADVELPNSTSTDFERNLRGLQAVMRWLSETP